MENKRKLTTDEIAKILGASYHEPLNIWQAMYRFLHRHDKKKITTETPDTETPDVDRKNTNSEI